ncbi:chemotaxis protein CheB [Flavobacterium sp.]|uniref:chemotaxis protein CheB n=1 Tax=Flavobacterium sp. TaxID=239 RepID=UPI00286BE597|nr:chemotaxis protein CheB [Flavobacterium sp.]
MKAPQANNKHPEKLIKSDNQFPVIGVGASAGGLDAFKKLLKAIPIDSGMAYVLVQHLDPNHESMLTEILQKVTPIPVLEIADDIKVEPNHIYVIPSNKTMVATDGVLLLAPRPEKSKTERYLPIDLFFTSLAIVHQTHAIGVILSGTGTDGTSGLKAIKDYGGITFVQDEESAAYPDMPNSAVHEGVVDFILPPDKMPEKLLEVTKIITTPTSVEENLHLGDEEAFRQINAVLRIRKGTDFTYYKQTTIRRRILRRMAINKNAAPAEYLNYLRENKPEQDLLYQDLLIPVTSFFRDSNVFDNLCANVFPIIKKDTEPGEPIRIWVAGCSTGEEAYSMAICLKEFLGSNSFDSEERVQIFATDLSERAILKARTGIYTKLEVVGLAPERLNIFFTKTNGSYQVNRQIRDLCVFATHNFLKDPPFGKMDLVSCRNVLIYMEPYLQKKALTTFHYALNPKGFLLLGKSETTSGVPDLFAATEKNDKLYTRKDVPSRFIHTVSPRTESNLIDNNDKPKTENMRSDFQKTADDIMLSKYSPAGVVINEAMDIVQFRGSTSRYLEQSSGKPSHNLLVLAKNGLVFELRNIIHKTKKGTVAVIKENVPVEINGSLTNITIEAIPLPNTIEPHYLILFHDSSSIVNKQEASENKKPTRKTKTDDKDLRIKQLELELTQAREDMRSITEDQEAANEELQSANEELLSGSEELQSLNEELETSKEELQSTNEELMVVNHEMIGLNEQIAAARNYAESIVANIREPLLVLDKNLRIKTANKAFYKTFRVNEKETEGILIYDLGNKQWDIPELRNLLEKILPEKSIFNDFEVTHNFESIGKLIMLLNAREVINKNTSEKLILLSIEDITERKKALANLEESEHRYHNMIYSSPSMIAIFEGEDMIVKIANDAILNAWDENKDVIGKSILKVKPELIVQGFDKLLLNVYKTGVPYFSHETPVKMLRHGKEELNYFTFVYQAQRNVNGEIEGVAVIANEVTPQALLNKKIKESEHQLQKNTEHFEIATTAAEVGTWSLDIASQTLDWSALHKKMWGYDENLTDLVYEDWHKVILASDKEAAFAQVAEAFKTKTQYEAIYRIVRPINGDIRWMKSIGKYFYNKAGEPVTLTGVSIDITKQKNAEIALYESEKQFRMMAELMPQKVWTSDAEGNKDYFNKTLLDYSGKSFDELKGDGWEKIIHPDDWKNDKKQWQECLKTGKDYDAENRLLGKDGKYLWHLTRAVALKDDQGKIKMWIGSKTEIQEQKEQKEELEKAVVKRTTELHKANKKLVHESSEKEKRAAELVIANKKLIYESSEKEKRADELVKINKELEAFTYVSSHDLQEPLRKIQTFADRILEKEKLSDGGKKYFHLIEDAANRMQTLIKDLLSFSHLNTSERKFEITDLNTIIDTVKEDFKEIIDEKHATIEATELCKANIIAFQFQQLMQNLIGNALKFSKQNIPPHIIITSDIIKGSKEKNPNLSSEKEYCHITFADNGIGFEKEFNQKVFEVFQKLHGKEEYAGTGIGLAIVKKIVENHQGEITVKSELNKGTKFDIYLPAN